MSKRKELLQLRKMAEEQDWQVFPTSGGHLCWVAPNGKRVFSGSTPSDPRSFRNHIALMKKEGFKPNGESRG